VQLVVDAGQWYAEQQRELRLVMQRPAAELTAGFDELDGQGHRGQLRRVAGRNVCGIDGLFDVRTELVEDAGDDVPEQFIVVGAFSASGITFI
jgi:hypothetical protein